MLGKFLAALSPWPVILAITAPYLAVLAQGDAVLGPALLWGGLVGSLLVLGYTGLGLLVSFWSNTNRTSFFLSLGFYILCFMGTQWPGPVQKGRVGKLVQRANPIEAANEFLEKILVNNRTLHEFQSWLRAPVVFAVLVLGLLFVYAGPRLRLGGKQR